MKSHCIFCEVSQKMKCSNFIKFCHILIKSGYFNFLAYFTRNAMVYHIVKPQKYAAPLRKAGKICVFRGTKIIKLLKVWVGKWFFSFVYLISDQSLFIAFCIKSKKQILFSFLLYFLYLAFWNFVITNAFCLIRAHRVYFFLWSNK